MTRTGLVRDLPKIHTSNYCVAYLDVLGAEKFMNNDKDEEFLNNLNSIYFNALNDVAFSRVIDQKDIKVKIFSDNILLAIKIKRHDELRKEKIEKIVNLTGNIFNNALYHGYLMRGAITEGQFYNDDSNIFVYGKALLDAVKMEEKLAIYPRIIVQKSIQKTLPQYFDECADGSIMLNHFVFEGLIRKEAYKQSLIDMYQRYSDDDKIRQKIMWAITYFNSFYSNSHFTSKVQITKEELDAIKENEVQDV